MPKSIFEDIKPLSRENKLPPNTEVPVYSRPPSARPPLPREVPFVPEEPKRGSRYALWYIAAACIVGFLFSLSFLLEHAAVTITPKSVPVALDATDTFTATKDSTDPEQIAYTIMSLPGEQSIKLPSTKSETLSQTAKGTVILYNSYSTSAYKLVKSTRLATPSGLIYRLDAATSVPGYTTSGGVVTPGSVQATVTADKPGEDGNIGPSDFTLPGLLGTPQASKIYARSKDAFTGGIVGPVYSVDQSAADAALASLAGTLKNTLAGKAKVQIPDGYVYMDGATVFTPSDSSAEPYSKEQEVTIALKGTFTAYLLKEDTLAHALATKYISQYNGTDPIYIPDAASLTLSPSGTLTPATDTTLTFSLAGLAHVVSKIDPESVKASIVGKKKSLFNNILSAIPGVDQADVVLKPFWKQSFPTDPKRITVTIAGE